MRCTVIRPDGARVDFRVRAPVGCSAAEVVPLLREQAGLDDTATIRIDGQPLRAAQVWGLPPLLDGCLLVAAMQPVDSPARTEDGLLELHVVGGLEAGRIHRLRPGRHVVGRSASAAVTVASEDVSRHHAALEVGPGGVRVSDLRSTNGTVVDGRRVPAGGVVVRAGQRIRVGRTTLAVRVPGSRIAAVRATGTGLLEVNRPPREPAEPGPVSIRRPARPAPRQPSRVPWLTALLPLVVAVPIALVARQPHFLLFALLSPVMVVGTIATERLNRRREHREAMRTWLDEDRAVSGRLRTVLATELALRRHRAADPAELLRVAEGPSIRLWERSSGRGEALELCVGTARLRAAVRVIGDGAAEDEEHWHDDAPVQVALPPGELLGIAGPRQVALPLARHLLGQAVTWHSPAELVLVVLTAPGREGDWCWARLLPHLEPVTAEGLAALLQRRRRADSPPGRPPAAAKRLLLLADLADDVAWLAPLLSESRDAGTHVMLLDDSTRRLPDGCSTVVEVHADGSARVSWAPDQPQETATVRQHVAPGRTLHHVTVDGAGPGWAWRLARALAPLRDAAPVVGGEAVPASVALIDLHEADVTDPVALKAQWHARRRTTVAPVGAGSEGTVAVDILRDGPHLLVGGTTGSGKSELLQTLVVSLALGNRPDELAFVLVDYKGGAAFRGCAGLPHVTGLVTTSTSTSLSVP